jgi:hypothetical protein
MPATVAAPVVGALAKAVAGVTVKYVPWANLIQRYQSYNLLITGQERSGKSTLYWFLRLNRLGERDEKTPPTVDHEDSGCFLFEWRTEDGGNLSAAFRNVSDQSGQKEPKKLAELIVDQTPHLIIIVLDITAKDDKRIHSSYRNWLDNLCSHLTNILNSHSWAKSRLIRKLRKIIILLNKVD